MKPIIRVEKLSKRYRIGERQAAYQTLRDAVADAVRTRFRRQQNQADTNRGEFLWALRDLNFDVAAGEVLGIIGRNGAGKSTLLKIISRVTEPTSGRVTMYGRVGSLLEVGTGFHPELTGRENIYLNGAILGMKRAEIKRQFDEIVAFSEIEKFINMPVKWYSSGMYMRLAFAVAAHLEPEVLVVDEVLAVGDAAFQRKCIGKMDSVAKHGRTVLFVSHNMTAMQQLCSRVIWLDDGQIVTDGEAHQVVARYLEKSFSNRTDQVWEQVETAPGNETVRLHRATVRPVDGSAASPITVRTPFVMEFEFWCLRPDTVLNFSLVLVNGEGIVLFNTGPRADQSGGVQSLGVGLFRTACFVPGELLNDGTIRVDLYVIKDQSVAIYQHEHILSFEVREAPEVRRNWYGKIIGAVRPNLRWVTERVEDDSVRPESSAAGRV